VWAVLIGVVAGAAGLLLDRLMHVMRAFTRRLDATSVVLTATVGGLGLGLLYVVGGETVRFSGIPELVHAVNSTTTPWRALLLAAVKLTATSWCLAVGFRGGKIFPAAYIGGMVGLTMHLFVHAIPVEVAWGVGLAAALATALGTPVLAVLVVASVESPAMLPLAVIGVVAAHTVHLLGDQLRAAEPGTFADATGTASD
jgi:H+/Cl- antiporter ClcA